MLLRDKVITPKRLDISFYALRGIWDILPAMSTVFVLIFLMLDQS